MTASVKGTMAPRSQASRAASFEPSWQHPNLKFYLTVTRLPNVELWDFGGCCGPSMGIPYLSESGLAQRGSRVPQNRLGSPHSQGSLGGRSRESCYVHHDLVITMRQDTHDAVLLCSGVRPAFDLQIPPSQPQATGSGCRSFLCCEGL